MTERCLNEHLVPSDGSLKVTGNFKMDFLGIDDRMRWIQGKVEEKIRSRH